MGCDTRQPVAWCPRLPLYIRGEAPRKKRKRKGKERKKEKKRENRKERIVEAKRVFDGEKKE
mgnify:CR=1 FL=1